MWFSSSDALFFGVMVLLRTHGVFAGLGLPAPGWLRRDMLAKGELVVTGRIVGGRRYGTGALLIGERSLPATWYVADFTIDGTIKGKAPAETIEIMVAAPGDSSTHMDWLDYFDLLPEGRCLLLLKPSKLKEGAYVSAVRPNPAVPLAPEPPPAEAAGERVEARLKKELLLAADCAKPTISVPALRAIRSLQYDGPQVRSLMRKLSRSNTAAVAVEALRTRLRRSDWDALDDILARSRAATKDAEAMHPLCSDVEAIGAIEANAKLRALLASPDARFRASACQALARMLQRPTVAVIIKCLEDTDREVRFHALVGLVDVAAKYHLEGWPNLAFGRDQERRAVKAWKQWWAEKGRYMFP